MKYLVVSDSHGDIMRFIEALEREKPDGILHLGDFSKDAEDLLCLNICDVKWVKGNCDVIDSWSSEEEIISLGGFRILMSHGHIYRVKSGMQLFKSAAEENEVDIALFGHTHIPYKEMNSGICYFNPGSAYGDDGTYGVLEINSDGYFLEHRYL
jgi:putative phosphoesterase